MRLLVTLLALLVSACSVRKLAINELGDALAQGGTTFASDDDPELVGDALPFTLKLIESLLAESPEHRGLLLAATSGFSQYSYGWVHQKADEIEEEDLEAATKMRERARRLYLRARGYGLRGLETSSRNFASSLRRDSAAALRSLDRDDVPLLYWTAASWGLAISLSKDNPDVVADLPLVEAMVRRAAELDEGFESGAVHTFLMTLEASRPGGGAEALERTRRHFDRAVELSGGLSAAPFVSFAEQVTVTTQDRAQFESLLNRALAIDVDAKPELRLANLIAQRRARWLLDHIDDLFLITEEGTRNEPGR